MLVYLIRHGETIYNAEHRYQGFSDTPLSAKGRGALQRAPFDPKKVYVSPLTRAVETACILFPSAELIAVDALKEMNFGAFEGRNYLEMEHDAGYRAWVEGGCTGRCPGGESRAEFFARAAGAAASLLDAALEHGEKELVIVAHGGIQMAVMARFARPERDYFAWKAPNGGGYLLSGDTWRKERKLDLMEEICYAEGEAVC